MNDESSTEKTITVPRKGRKALKAVLIILSYAAVAVISWHAALRIEMDPARQQAKAQRQVQSIVDEVGKLMIVSKDEVPQVATISDAENLAKTQAFFANAQNGDQVLIYLQDQKAIIYRPSQKMIVNVGPIVAENNEDTTGATQQQSQNTPDQE